MQMQEMYVSFGVLPPTLEQEQQAQVMMEKDDDCHAFIVCTRTRIGDEKCPVHLEGRAQLIVVAPGVAQVRADTKIE